MHSFWNDFPSVRDSLASVVSAMDAALSDPSFPLGDDVRAMIANQGKMLRPGLLLLAAGLGKPSPTAVGLAAAIELLHTATLVHDDVIDRSDSRRGIPTLHVRHGAKDAVLAGDWIFAKAFALAAERAKPEHARALAALVGHLCAAEVRQDKAKFSWNPSLRAYRRVISGKTASLFAAAFRAGGQEAGARRQTLSRLQRAGYNVGMAFQILDDILDYSSSAATMGKPVGNDLREGLCTLPLALALKAAARSGGGQEARLCETLARIKPESAPDDACASVIAAVRESGALEGARELATSYTARALREIGGLPAGQARNDLKLAVSRLLSRES